MPYQKFPPHPRLSPFVDDYFFWESADGHTPSFTISSPAQNCFAMVFNYGDLYGLSNSQFSKWILPREFLSGLTTESYSLHLKGKIAMAGIIFKGSAFMKLFKVPPAASFMDARLDLWHILRHQAAALTEQLAEALDQSARVQLLDAFLLGRIRQLGANRLTFADRAANIILEKHGMVKMDALAEELCLSPRQFRRIFKQQLGINPKLFARIKRFNYVNLMLTRNANLSWRGFLDQEGYYDQSHLIKDYQEFFGSKPSLQILQNRQQSALLAADSR